MLRIKSDWLHIIKLRASFFCALDEFMLRDLYMRVREWLAFFIGGKSEGVYWPKGVSENWGHLLQLKLGNFVWN